MGPKIVLPQLVYLAESSPAATSVCSPQLLRDMREAISELGIKQLAYNNSKYVNRKKGEKH